MFFSFLTVNCLPRLQATSWANTLPWGETLLRIASAMGIIVRGNCLLEAEKRQSICRRPLERTSRPRLGNVPRLAEWARTLIPAVGRGLAKGLHGTGLRSFCKEHALSITSKDPSLVQPTRKFPTVGIDPVLTEPPRRWCHPAGRSTLYHRRHMPRRVHVCPKGQWSYTSLSGGGLELAMFGIGFTAADALRYPPTALQLV